MVERPRYIHLVACSYSTVPYDNDSGDIASTSASAGIGDSIFDGTIGSFADLGGNVVGNPQFWDVENPQGC